MIAFQLEHYRLDLCQPFLRIRLRPDTLPGCDDATFGIRRTEAVPEPTSTTPWPVFLMEIT